MRLKIRFVFFQFVSCWSKQLPESKSLFNNLLKSLYVRDRIKKHLERVVKLNEIQNQAVGIQEN